MGLFKTSPPGTADRTTISSIVGDGMTITGDLSFSGKLKLDGDVKGDVKGEYLIVGKTGVVTGDIHTETCICQGRVVGNIKSRNLSVIRGCRIEGNVETINLAVESGASLIGEVKVDDKDLRLIKKDTASTPHKKLAKTANGV